MNVNLGATFDHFVADLLNSGLYQTQSEILREGLRLLKEREDVKQLHLANLRRETAIGTSEAERGDLVGGPGVFAAIRRRNAARKRAK